MKTLAEQSMKPAAPCEPTAAAAETIASNNTANNNNNNKQHNKPIRLVDISNHQASEHEMSKGMTKNGHQKASYLNESEARKNQKNSIQNYQQNQRLHEQQQQQQNGRHQVDSSDRFILSESSAKTHADEKLVTRQQPPVGQQVKTAQAKSSSSSPGVDKKNADKKPPAASQEPERQEISLVAKLTADCMLYLIKGIIAVFDLISWPVYYYKQSVGERRREVDHLRSVQLDPQDPSSPWRQIDIPEFQLEIERKIDAYENYDQMMRASFRANAQLPCYAYRQVLEEVWHKRPDNPDKLIRQVRLSDYKWCSFAQFDAQIEAARVGLLRDGVRAGQRVILFADTRPEWQICSQALIRLGAIVVTMYSTLGIDGIVHTVNETQAELIIAQGDKVNRLLRLSAKLPKLKRVIYFEPSLFLPLALGGLDKEDEREFRRAAERTTLDGLESAATSGPVECVNFCKLLRQGLEEVAPEQLASLEGDNQRALRALGPEARAKTSLAVIMYTSGSTGIPKGVLISHENIMATVKAFSYVTKDYIHEAHINTCTAYLPLAHIFEFCIESVMLYHGVKFGFASPHTLTDKSPGLMPGQSGDLIKLQPTVLIIVPLILDRIVQGVKQALRQQSYFKEQLVSYLIEYKSYWQRRHYDTPLVDKIVCSKMAVALGGKARFVICGSAPLSSQTQTFVRAALNLKLPQGFGTTETVAATSCQLFDDQSTGNVGVPLSGTAIKLEPWLEGNYRPTDKPNPRGEIVVGGENIAQGYYQLEEATREAFYVDATGTRWYRTGDIGEMLPNGQLKIIDRKKDLVKLQNGEYISLGRVESTLKSNPYTDNFCVFANSNYNYIVALGPANELAIRNLAQQIVDESERKLSPSMMRRMGGSTLNLANGGGADGAQATVMQQERETLLMSEDDRALALEELKEVLASYESDLLNNNNSLPASSGGGGKESAAAASASERRGDGANDATGKSSKTSAGGGGGDKQQQPQQHKARADSGVPPPMGSCLNERLNRLCENKLILERVLAYVCKLARERNLMSLEIPKKLMLLAEEWTEDKNLVTAAMKIRRNFIYKRYERELEQIYTSN